MLHNNGARNEQLSEPDESFFYNNDFFTILGLIVEKVSDMKFEDYVKENILKPLRMERTTYTREDFDKNDNISAVIDEVYASKNDIDIGDKIKIQGLNNAKLRIYGT